MIHVEIASPAPLTSAVLEVLDASGVRRWNPNIQTVRTLVGKTPKKLNVCTSCIKAGKVARV